MTLNVFFFFCYNKIWKWNKYISCQKFPTFEIVTEERSPSDYVIYETAIGKLVLSTTYIHVCVCVYIYIYMCVCVHIYVKDICVYKKTHNVSSHFRDLNSVTFSLNTRFISGQHGTQGYQIAANFPSGPRTNLTQPGTPFTLKVCRCHNCFRNVAFACGDCWCCCGSESCSGNRQILKTYRPPLTV